MQFDAALGGRKIQAAGTTDHHTELGNSIMGDEKKHSTGPREAGRSVARRNLVKGVALGVGGVSLSHWSKPVVQDVILPAHAQTSAGQLTAPGSLGYTFLFANTKAT